jgi:hypothetical protein
MPSLGATYALPSTPMCDGIVNADELDVYVSIMRIKLRRKCSA